MPLRSALPALQGYGLPELLCARSMGCKRLKRRFETPDTAEPDRAWPCQTV